MPALLPLLGKTWQYLVMALLLAGLLWYRSELHDTKAAIASAVAAADKKAEMLSTDLLIEQAKSMAVTEKVRTEYVDVIRNAPDDAAKYRAGTAGVRAIIRGAQPQAK